MATTVTTSHRVRRRRSIVTSSLSVSTTGAYAVAIAFPRTAPPTVSQWHFVHWALYARDSDLGQTTMTSEPDSSPSPEDAGWSWAAGKLYGALFRNPRSNRLVVQAAELQPGEQ